MNILSYVYVCSYIIHVIVIHLLNIFHFPHGMKMTLLLISIGISSSSSSSSHQTNKQITIGTNNANHILFCSGSSSSSVCDISSGNKQKVPHYTTHYGGVEILLHRQLKLPTTTSNLTPRIFLRQIQICLCLALYGHWPTKNIWRSGTLPMAYSVWGLPKTCVEECPSNGVLGTVRRRVPPRLHPALNCTYYYVTIKRVICAVLHYKFLPYKYLEYLQYQKCTWARCMADIFSSSLGVLFGSVSVGSVPR